MLLLRCRDVHEDTLEEVSSLRMQLMDCLEELSARERELTEVRVAEPVPGLGCWWRQGAGGEWVLVQQLMLCAGPVSGESCGC